MNLQSLKLFLKETFIVGLVLSLTVFAWLRLIFFEVPFSVSEDGLILIKTILCGWTMIMILKAAWLTILLIAQKINALKAAKKVEVVVSH
jgi:hypothetical protein